MLSLNTYLKDDKLFLLGDLDNNEGKKKNANKLIILELNKKGIFTVEDLIKCDCSQFGSSNSHYYNALIQIMKYRYLGNDLENDILLESVYTHSNKDLNRLVMDLRRLGFGRNIKHFRDLIFDNKYIIDVLFGEDTFTMENFLNSDSDSGEFLNKIPNILRNHTIGNIDLVKIYLEYIREKKEKLASPKEKLIRLKNELEGLIKKRNSLDNQIDEINQQINFINEEEQHYRGK